MNQLAKRCSSASDSLAELFLEFALVHAILFEQEWLDIALDECPFLIEKLPRISPASLTSFQWTISLYKYHVSAQTSAIFFVFILLTSTCTGFDAQHLRSSGYCLSTLPKFFQGAREHRITVAVCYFPPGRCQISHWSHVDNPVLCRFRCDSQYRVCGLYPSCHGLCQSDKAPSVCI